MAYPPFYDHVNFCYGTVLTAPSPAISGTSLTLSAGVGALCPAAPFVMTVRTAAAPYSYECILVTAVVGDVLTIQRAFDDSTAYAIAVGDLIGASIASILLKTVEAQVFVSLEVAVPSGYSDTGSIGQWAVDEANGLYWRCYDTDKWFTIPIALA